MSRSLLFRLKAAGLHLLGSAVAIGLFLWLVYGYWYMHPYQIVFSTMDVVKILVGVDLVLGPLLTLIVFNVAKPRKELARDLGLILAVQLSALAWGVQVTYSVRPQFAAFVGNNVYVVTGRDVHLDELPAEISKRSWYQPPVAVSVQGPQSEAEWRQHMADLFNEKVPDLMYQAQRYRPYAERATHSQILPFTAEELSKRSDAVRVWVESVQATDNAGGYEYYNILSGTFTSLAAVRAEDGVIISVMPVQPVPLPENKP